MIFTCPPFCLCISSPHTPHPLPSGLHLVNLNGPAPWFRAIQVAGPLAAPSVLRYMATPSTSSEQVLGVEGLMSVSQSGKGALSGSHPRPGGLSSDDPPTPTLMMFSLP